MYDNISKMSSNYIEYAKSQDSLSNLETIHIPKFDNKNWPNFKSTIEEYLGRIFDRHNIPILYVVREADINNFDDIYESCRDKLSSCISHTGPLYKSDNGIVFSTLVQHTKNTEGDSMVSSEKRTCNGRGAWRNLLLHFEGTTYKERLL